MASRAIIFPGQGAQAVGMGHEFFKTCAECEELFERANEVLSTDLAELCFKGPIESLTVSSNAQPAIFLVSVAAYTYLKREVPDFDFAAAAGLSSGEWAALHIADVISFDDALRVLEVRGRLMQESCEKYAGGMVSVLGLGEDVLEDVCRQSGAEIANINSPGQIVLSGLLEVVERAESLARDAGAKKCIRLTVAGAFHSSLMEDASKQFLEVLEHVPLEVPRHPVVSNVTGKPHESLAGIREAMALQIRAPVQWVKSIGWMGEQGINEYVECGPGNVLTGLVKRIDRKAALHTIQDPSNIKALLNDG